MRWEGHVDCMGERRGAYRVLVGEPKGKRQLGRPRCRWEDNIKMDLQEVGWGGHGLICSGQGQVAGTCKRCNKLLSSTKHWELLDQLKVV